MEIDIGIVKLDKPTKEINIYRLVLGTWTKAQIVSARQDKLGRVYLKVK